MPILHDNSFSLTQISTMQLMSFMVAFLKIVKLWLLKMEFYVELPLILELNTWVPKFDDFFKMDHKANNLRFESFRL